LLQIACGAAKNKFPHLNTIVGVAIAPPKFYEKNAEDFILMECHEWRDDDRAYYAEANGELKFFETDALNMRYRTVQNFPENEAD
jgi:hypothetical protein